MKPTNFLRLILIIVTLSVLQSTHLCLPAIADDLIRGNGGGAGTDDGADSLVNTGGGARSMGMPPDEGGADLGNSEGPVVELDTKDGPAEPNASAEKPSCAAASSMFAPALAAMGENPCP